MELSGLGVDAEAVTKNLKETAEKRLLEKFKKSFEKAKNVTVNEYKVHTFSNQHANNSLTSKSFISSSSSTRYTQSKNQAKSYKIKKV